MAKKSGSIAVPTQIITITIDHTDDDILRYNLDEGYTLSWVYNNMRELSDTVVDQLRRVNLMAYVEAMTLRKSWASEKAAQAAHDSISVMNPLGTDLSRRLALRPRRGYHQVWRRPGSDYDSAVRYGPYTPIRSSGTDAKGKKLEEAPGCETGEIIKLLDSDGKVELIACECPQDLYESYLKWVSAESRKRYVANKQTVFSEAERANIISRRPEARVKVIDDEGDLQM